MTPSRPGIDRPPRWRAWLWPALAIVCLALLLAGWVAGRPVEQRQDRVVPLMAVFMLAATALGAWTLLWLVFLSRLRWTVRLAVPLVVLVGFGAIASMVRLRGVSGDVLPDLEWRWTGDPAELPVDLPVNVVAGRAPSSAGDYPQFLGPNRNGTVQGRELADRWTEPPRLVWRREVGAGWSGFAVSGDFAVTQEQRGEREVVTCYALATGDPIWVHADEAGWSDPLGGPGPRATPSIESGVVYALGGTGILNALDLASGRRIWSRNVIDENGARIPDYGVSASPLVTDGRVIVAAGGDGGRSLAAYEASTGAPLWTSGYDRAAYSSPQIVDLAGVRQILLLGEANIAGYDAADGGPLWQHPWPGETQKASQPVVVGDDRVFVSSGYGVGAKLFRIERNGGGSLEPRLLWESRGLKAKFTNVIFHDGYLYGLDDGILVCLDPADGSRCWKRGRHGHGQILLADDRLIVMGERGEVTLVLPGPEKYDERGSFPALDGKTWNHPALAGRMLLVRNDREAACWELPARQRGTST